MRLDGKVALITGGGSGMGKVASELFAAEGASVVLTDVNDEAGAATAAAIGDAAHYVHADVSLEADARAMVDATIERFGRLDVLYNNAGVMLPDDGSVDAMDERIWDITLGVNVKGVAFGCKYGIPAMLATGGGSIINVASFVAWLGAATSPDGLHRVQGRRARDDPGDRGRVRAKRHPLQRVVPRPDRDPAAPCPPVGRGEETAPLRAHPDGPTRPGRGARQGARCSSRATTAAS